MQQQPSAEASFPVSNLAPPLPSTGGLPACGCRPRAAASQCWDLFPCVRSSTAPPLHRFLGFLLAGAGVMQQQAMQCANPFRSTLGIQACYAYELLDTRAKGHIL